MIKPGSKLSATLLTVFAFALALALPGFASAQDPSVDQYTPTAPDGGGSVPTSPVPNTDGGNGPGPSGESNSGGSSDPSGDESAGGTAPVAPVATDPADPAAGTTGDDGSGGANKHQSKDERTLAGIAAAASQQREDAGAARADGPATDLLRSDNGGGLGMGILLWAVLGVTALWAVATVVRRRQDGDGHPA